MPESPPKYDNNSKTIPLDADVFQFETLQQSNGNATQIKFQLDDKTVNAGDCIVVLSGADIYFHGMISSVENGEAIASDSRGSLLPATVQ